MSAARHHGDEGAGSTELVIAVPLLMLVILLVIQYAIWADAAHVAQATATEALAAARVQGGTAAAGQQRGRQVLTQAGHGVLPSSQVTVTRGAATVTVTVTGAAERLLPVPGLPLAIHVTVTGPAERFTASQANPASPASRPPGLPDGSPANLKRA